MLDTVKLQSPELDEATAQAVTAQLELRSCVDLKSGELLYEFTSGGLSGSYDHRISVQVKRERWQQPRTPQGDRAFGRKASPILVPCEPYLLLEGSVHKALLGHNVHGGNTPGFLEAVRPFLASLP